VRLLAAVRALVPLEVARLSSPVLAAGVVALVRLLAAVRALVPLDAVRVLVVQRHDSIYNHRRKQRPHDELLPRLQRLP
jgi:hypothetical protein